ncbi:MAG: CBS domain-containing protein [Candidatus Brocadiales bacterium]
MQVKDVMSKEVITVTCSTTLKELLGLFAMFHAFPLIPVVKEDNLLVGIVSFRNLICVVHPQLPEILKTIPFLDEEKEDIFRVKLPKEIGDLVVGKDIIIEREFVSIQEDASLEEAYNLMKLHLKEQFPVVNKAGRLVGIIGIFDIIWEVFCPEDVI